MESADDASPRGFAPDVGLRHRAARRRQDDRRPGAREDHGLPPLSPPPDHRPRQRLLPVSTDPASSYERLVVSYRRLFFEEAARSGLQIITTAGWRFDLPSEEEAIRSYAQPFVERGGRVYVVELLAPLEVRLARNLTENRRRHKRTDWSTEEALRQDAAQHRYDSGGILPLDLPLLRIETEHLTAEDTAARIHEHFGLP